MDQSVSFVNVEDSQTSTRDVTAYGSVDVDNNDDAETSPHWVFAQSRYWVGPSGGNTNDAANWSLMENSCGTGGGASVPNFNQLAIFSNTCVNNSNVNSTFNPGGILIETGHTGTVIANALINVDGPFTMQAGNS